MIEVFHLCQSIASVLDGHKFAYGFRASAEWELSISVAQIDGLTVTIVPESLRKTALTRRTSHTSREAVLSLLIHENLEGRKNLITSYSELSGSIEKHLFESGQFEVPDDGLTWQIQSSESVFVREHIEKLSLFTCGFLLTFTSSGE